MECPWWTWFRTRLQQIAVFYCILKGKGASFIHLFIYLLAHSFNEFIVCVGRTRTREKVYLYVLLWVYTCVCDSVCALMCLRVCMNIYLCAHNCPGRVYVWLWLWMSQVPSYVCASLCKCAWLFIPTISTNAQVCMFYVCVSICMGMFLCVCP